MHRLLRTVALCPLCIAVPALAQISETFDTGLNGWTNYGDTSTFAWSSTAGNPGGCAHAFDAATGAIWSFQAPATFNGDKSCYYGGTLQWDINCTGASNIQNSQPDASIMSPTGNLFLDLDASPANTWTTRTITLHETAGWRLNAVTGAVPTQAQFQACLANITALRLRGEYANGSDNGRLDNVFLMPTPGGCGPSCDSTDFNGDGLFPDTADIDDFLSVFSGGPCSTGTCGDTDFNNDGLFPDTLDIDALLSVFSGGPCL